MRKWIYLGICALGLTFGCSNPDAIKNKEVKDHPTKVTIENVYVHRYEPGKSTCLYSLRDRNIGSSENPREGSIALEYDIRIYDEDVIKCFYLGWGKYEGENSSSPFFSYKNEPKNKETNIWRLDNGYLEKDLKKIIFKVKAIDWKDNVKETEFTLDQILENAKPMKTKPMKLIDGQFECDENFNK